MNYSRTTITLVLLLGLAIGSLSVPAQAQVDIRPGLKGGVNLASLGGDDAEELIPDEFAEGRTGFTAGAFLVIDFGGMVALQPEVVYAQKGDKAEVSIGGQSASSTVKLDYVEVPVLARFSFPLDGRITPYVLAGPSVGFNINAETEDEDSSSGTSTTDISDNVSTTDFGLQGGAGVDVDISESAVLSVDARYEAGLTSVVDSDEVDIQNRGIRISVGIGF